MKTAFIGPGVLYSFLSHCNKSRLNKVVLDCGAGGSHPPLAMFHERDYRTYGIDISRKQMERARRFCRRNKMELNIQYADMRHLPFRDESMSFVYSYAAICHMTKKDAGIAMDEIKRVLKKNGLCFISFCAADDRVKNTADRRGPGEYTKENEGKTIIHSLYGQEEPDRFFQGCRLINKVWRRIENFGKVKGHAWAEIDYIARKL